MDRIKTSILCSSCGKDSGYCEEALIYFIAEYNLFCWNCNAVVILSTKTEWG